MLSLFVVWCKDASVEKGSQMLACSCQCLSYGLQFLGKKEVEKISQCLK